jgi:hypothetical protein
MTTLIPETESAAVRVKIRDEKLFVDLADGRTIAVPLDWYPRLLHASRRERKNWKLLGSGYAVEWPDLDEHIGVAELAAGRRSGESAKSLERWLSGRRR